MPEIIDSPVSWEREAGAPEVERVTLDMISAGVDAYQAFDPEQEEVEALVCEIIFRAFHIARRNRALRLSLLV